MADGTTELSAPTEDQLYPFGEVTQGIVAKPGAYTQTSPHRRTHQLLQGMEASFAQQMADQHGPQQHARRIVRLGPSVAGLHLIRPQTKGHAEKCDQARKCLQSQFLRASASRVPKGTFLVHDLMRVIVSTRPRLTPYSRTASIEYSEHVGE